MTAFADRFRAARDGGGDGGDWAPPNGAYETEVIDGHAGTAQSSGNDYALVRHRVTQGEHQGREFAHFMSLKDGRAFEISVGALSMYGVDMQRDYQSLDELAQAIKALKGYQTSVTVKTNGSFTNVTVGSSRRPQAQQSLGFATQSAPAPANAIGGADEDDDLPF